MQKWDITVFVAYNASVSINGETATNLWKKKREDGKSEVDILRELTSEGWEPVSVTPLNLSGDTQQVLFTFKRPRAITQKWEYSMLHVHYPSDGQTDFINSQGETIKLKGDSDEDILLHLNHLAGEGWEIADSSSEVNPRDLVTFTEKKWILKRLKEK